MLKRFEKSKTVPACFGSILGTSYTEEMKGYLDELCWNFIKKGMKVHPHKHPKKEAYLFTRGKGTMQVDNEKMSVKEGDIVFIPENALHTAWTDDEEDLEFIIIGVRKPHSLEKLAKKLAIH